MTINRDHKGKILVDNNKINSTRLEECNQIINQYYLGKLQSPIGIDKREFLEQYISALQARHEYE